MPPQLASVPVAVSRPAVSAVPKLGSAVLPPMDLPANGANGSALPIPLNLRPQAASNNDPLSMEIARMDLGLSLDDMEPISLPQGVQSPTGAKTTGPAKPTAQPVKPPPPPAPAAKPTLPPPAKPTLPPPPKPTLPPPPKPTLPPPPNPAVAAPSTAPRAASATPDVTVAQTAAMLAPSRNGSPLPKPTASPPLPASPPANPLAPKSASSSSASSTPASSPSASSPSASSPSAPAKSSSAKSSSAKPGLPLMPEVARRPRPPVNPNDSGSNDHFIGRVLGKYKLIRRVGRGAKGIVYEAENTRNGQAVAVKVLAPEISAGDPVSVQRFIREAEAAGQVKHVNVVHIETVAQSDGIIFIAMELVRGGSILDCLDKDGRLKPVEATRLMRQAALGLAAAHNAGVIHRDIKPANMLVTDDGTLKIADFGMAKMMHSTTSGLTEPGTLMGTPHYMSPEQCIGAPVDQRADLYSLGCAYYRLLVGRTPFGDPELSPLAVANKQINEVHPDPRKFREDVPGMCVRIIDRSLAKRPEERYQSAEEMAAALKAVEDSLRQTELMEREAERAAAAGARNPALTEESLTDILNAESSDDLAMLDLDKLSGLVSDNPFLAGAKSGARSGVQASANPDDSSEDVDPLDHFIETPASLSAHTPGQAIRLTVPQHTPHGTSHGAVASTILGPAGPAKRSAGAGMFAELTVADKTVAGMSASAGRDSARDPAKGAAKPPASKTPSGKPLTSAKPTELAANADPASVSFKFRFANADAAKAAFFYLREDVRSDARFNVSASLHGKNKVANAEIGVTVLPSELFGVVKTLIAAGGDFLSLTTDDKTLEQSLKKQIASVRK